MSYGRRPLQYKTNGVRSLLLFLFEEGGAAVRYYQELAVKNTLEARQ
jgi:hypothetical protein